MNHDHDRSRSLFSRSRPLLIYELTFGVRAGSGGPRLRPRDFHMADSRRQLVGDRAPGSVRLYTKQTSNKRRSNAAQNNVSFFRTHSFCVGRAHALTASSWFPLQLAGFVDGISSDTSIHVVQFPSVINISCYNTTSAQYASA